ncbi:MAG: hypothetical protein ACUBOA_09140 [Candidatus Loosdrechtia sp.]|uniref:hypothetical protein n=1 Tax=Candidatus Loosdrechtia sp. TaxID=3101272 RepID=UPI003A75DADD|nr:MAG: hypothetical protein QY305_02675 [Candidatus Jettenia sp. AMX2]
MKIYGKINLRRWHAWVGIILSLPIFIVGITAVFIAHEGLLGLKKIPVKADWLPGYKAQSVRTEYKEIKCILITQTGLQYIGTKHGLFIFDQGKLNPVKELRGSDIKNIVKSPNGVFVAANNGAWFFEGHVWKEVFKDDVHNISVSQNGCIYLVTVQEGLQVSCDGGQSWVPETEIMPALHALTIPRTQQKIHFAKLMIDLHTGKALLGKTFIWLWIDIISCIILFLTVSGVYLWRKMERQKAELQG